MSNDVVQQISKIGREKQMKLFKRLMAVMFALTLTLGMGTRVYAEGSETAEGPYTITINKDTSDKVAHTYDAYQIFKGDLKEEGEGTSKTTVLSNIQWGDNVTPATLITNLKKIDAFKSLADDASAATVAKAISDANLAKDSDGAKALADAIAASVTSPKKTAEIAADATSGTITGLPAGYYLVKDTAAVTGEGASTRYILEVVSDVTVTEKASIPTVIKKVKEKNDTTPSETGWLDAADYDIGDKIDYKLEGTLPSKFADFKKYTVYKFTDTLSKGLTYVDGSANVHLNTEDGTDITDLFDIAVNGQTLTVTLKESKDLRADNRFSATSKIIVLYKAELNNKAEIGSTGNPNEVYLEFSNNPNWNGEGTPDNGTTPEDKVIVFTYEIKALKVEPTSDAAIDKTTYDALPDAEKADYVKVGDKYQKTQALTGAGFTLFKKVGSDYVAVSDEVKTDSTFEFKGTDAGEYKLVETTVPGGYNKADDIEIKVEATYDTDSADPKLMTLSVTPAAAGFTVTTTPIEGDAEHITTDGIITGKILNQKGSTLPSTGGIGTTIFYVLGGLLVAGAGIVLVARKKASE